MPVTISTARPDGDVLHKVQYGQSLWSLATAYHTTVEKIRAWNNLDDATSISEGYLLLVQKGATQPAPASVTPVASATNFTKAPTSTLTTGIITPEIIATSTPTALIQEDKSERKSPIGWMMTVIFIVFIGGILSVFLIRSPEKPKT